MPFTAVLKGNCGQAWEIVVTLCLFSCWVLQKLASVVSFMAHVIHTYPW